MNTFNTEPQAAVDVYFRFRNLYLSKTIFGIIYIYKKVQQSKNTHTHTNKKNGRESVRVFEGQRASTTAVV